MEHLQKHNILEFQRKMRAIPGWEILEEPGLTATRTPAGDALGNDVWAEVTDANLARARRFYQGQPFCWLVEEGQGTAWLEAAGGVFREPDYEMVAPLPSGRRAGAGVVEAAGGRVTKVILETGLLTDAEKITACQICKKAGSSFVKTATGFAKGSAATAEDIALMRKTVGPEMGVKASGGVRSQADARLMIANGATRLGTSASIAIVTGGQGSGY